MASLPRISMETVSVYASSVIGHGASYGIVWIWMKAMCRRDARLDVVHLLCTSQPPLPLDSVFHYSLMSAMLSHVTQSKKLHFAPKMLWTHWIWCWDCSFLLSVASVFLWHINITRYQTFRPTSHHFLVPVDFIVHVVLVFLFSPVAVPHLVVLSRLGWMPLGLCLTSLHSAVGFGRLDSSQYPLVHRLGFAPCALTQNHLIIEDDLVVSVYHSNITYG